MATRVDNVTYDSIEYSGATIDYRWCHSRRRTLGITVRPDKVVSVRVPLRTSVKEVRKFVQLRAEWVVKILNKLDAQPVKPEQDYGRGALFMYLGDAYRLEFMTGQGSSLILHDGLLIMTVPEILTEELVRKRIDAWYRKQALKVVRERSVLCHSMMRDQDILLPRITIRSMKTRWGSYSYRTQRITLNLNLIKAPQACLDYVIIHELCHIKVRHHGPEFWKMVGRYIPNYLEVRNQMKHFM